MNTENNGTKVINDEKYCRILGTNVQNNLNWFAHLEGGVKALLPDVRKKIGALKHLGKKIPSRCKNILARGLVTSKITYLISIWGGDHPKSKKEGSNHIKHSSKMGYKSS